MSSRTIEFTILPSMPSMMVEAIVVLVLFILLNVYIIYLSAYDSGYKPNFVMLLNFIFDDPTSLKNFKTYIKNIAVDKVSIKEIVADKTKINTKESFSNNDNFVSKTIFSIKKFMTKLFVKGKKIVSVQTI
jgi:hypothetical protein